MKCGKCEHKIEDKFFFLLMTGKHSSKKVCVECTKEIQERQDRIIVLVAQVDKFTEETVKE